jgi:hypothetical protein
VSAKIEEGDVRGAVRLAVSDDSLAPCSESTVEALRKLHPSRAASTTNSLAFPEPDTSGADVLIL